MNAAINRSRVRLPAAALPGSDPGQVVHLCPAPLKLLPYDIDLFNFNLNFNAALTTGYELSDGVQ